METMILLLVLTNLISFVFGKKIGEDSSLSKISLGISLLDDHDIKIFFSLLDKAKHKYRGNKNVLDE